METKEEISPLLNSLNLQLGFDYSTVEYILVNDGTNNVFPKEFLNSFEKLNIRTIYMSEDLGPGLARQMGIDNARGDYVMFCDADDVMQNIHVLSCFIEAIDVHKPEVITSTWLGEVYNPVTGKAIYIPCDNDITWVFGKAFSRKFLQKYDIRFHEDLRSHEDTYFNNLVYVHSKETFKLPITSYVWIYREDSLTRMNNKAYTFESIPDFIKSLSKVCEKIEETYPEQMESLVIHVVTTIFFIIHHRDWLTPNRRELFKKTEDTFCKLMKPYIKYYKNAPADLFIPIYNTVRTGRFINEVETETLGDWIKRLSL
jgi:glycosyltransferase involved in cell wall biosynthesis